MAMETDQQIILINSYHAILPVFRDLDLCDCVSAPSLRRIRLSTVDCGLGLFGESFHNPALFEEFRVSGDRLSPKISSAYEAMAQPMTRCACDQQITTPQCLTIFCYLPYSSRLPSPNNV